jgi:alkylhydroperoxidase/carboxymuconolactone decarboxylase family protein YurZ
MASGEELERAWQYARDYYRDEDVEASFRLLAAYAPDVFAGYMSMRQGAFPVPDLEGSRFSAKWRELLMVGIEVAALMSPPPTYHARRAIEAGATPQDVAEVVALCIVLRGMISYQQSGRYALEAAHEHAAALASGGAAEPR